MYFNDNSALHRPIPNEVTIFYWGWRKDVRLSQYVTQFLFEASAKNWVKYLPQFIFTAPRLKIKVSSSLKVGRCLKYFVWTFYALKNKKNIGASKIAQAQACLIFFLARLIFFF